MKYILIIIFFMFNSSLKSQDEEFGGTREIYIWTINTGVSVRIQTISQSWGHYFELTDEYCNYTLLDNTVTVPSNYSGYALGWDNVVLPCSQTNLPPYFGYALHKVTFGDNRFVFYFDMRDSDYDGTYPCANDFYFVYDYVQNTLKINIDGFCNDVSVNSRDYMNIWEMNGKTSPTTLSFENYWQNSLALIPTWNNHPRLVWGPHPTFSATNYRVYRAVSNNPVNPLSLSYTQIHQTINSSTFEFTDNAVTILPGYQYAYYYVAGWNGTSESAKTNYVGTPAEFHKVQAPESDVQIPKDFALYQNYPNPFNPSTTIKFALPVKTNLSLSVYNTLGEKVAEIFSGELEEGYHEMMFNASGLSSGIYFYKIESENFNLTQKMILMK